MRLFLAIVLAMSLTGCNTLRKGTRTVESAPVLTKQAAKDAKIVSAANTIDTVTAPTPVAQEVKEQTDVIRAAVKEAPAADVAALTKSLEEAVAKAEARADKAEEKSNTAVKIALFLVSGLITAAGVVIALTGAQIPLFGPKAGFAVASGGAAMFALTIAYDWCLKHPTWVGIGLAVIFASALGMMYSNFHHHNEAKK